MSNNIKAKSNESINLSIKNIDYQADNNTSFSFENIPFTQLESAFKKYNYSTIKWNPTRSKSNFVSATGFVVDFDKGQNIEEIESFLNEGEIKYFLITSKRHTDEHHRFHVLLPFENTVTDFQIYEDLVKTIHADLFPSSDPTVTEAARFYFGSPDNARYSTNYSTAEKYIDNIILPKEDAKLASKLTASKSKSDAWDDDLEVELADGTKVKAAEIGSKQRIMCPFHEDTTPSAFIDFSQNSGNYFIHCSACDTTFWKVDPQANLKSKCDGFWSVRSTVHKSDIVGDEFSLQDIGREKFYIFTDAKSKDENDDLLRYLVKNKHIHAVQRVDNQLDMNTDKSHYRFNDTESVFEVFIAPRKHAGIKDNQFIENYLEEIFRNYKVTMKEWLAVYFYTNYQKLPYLILKGERATGKNTFAESIADMTPTLSEIPNDLTGSFNPHAEKKLLIIDETLEGGKVQYQTLKKLSGTSKITVNKKYQQQYSVKNNLNLIFLSNEHLPIFVEREELPKDEKNNQFFVYKMPKLNRPIDPDFKQKLCDRMYHYITTELKTVFDSLHFDGKRYSINVPITEEEKDLFGDNVTELDYDVNGLVQKYVEEWDNPNSQWKKYIDKDFLPNSYINMFTNLQHRRSSVIKNMKSRGYLKAGNVERLQVGTKREYGHYFGPRFKEELNKIKPQSDKPTPQPTPLFG